VVVLEDFGAGRLGTQDVEGQGEEADAGLGAESLALVGQAEPR
jgi:hypothetical protein